MQSVLSKEKYNIGEYEMVNLIGEKIRHKTLGIGEVISVKGNYITIKFLSKIASFVYPDAFKKYLIPEDNKIADAVNSDLMMAMEIEVKKKVEDETQKAEEERQQQFMQQEEKNKKKAEKYVNAKGKIENEK